MEGRMNSPQTRNVISEEINSANQLLANEFAPACRLTPCLKLRYTHHFNIAVMNGKIRVPSDASVFIRAFVTPMPAASKKPQTRITADATDSTLIFFAIRSTPGDMEGRIHSPQTSQSSSVIPQFYQYKTLCDIFYPSPYDI